MKLTTTLILLVLVVAAGIYLWTDRTKPSTEEKKRVAKRVFKEFDPTKVFAISITVHERTNDAGPVIRTEQFDLERDLAGWTLVRPVNFPADDTKIRQMLDQTKKIDQDRVIAGDDYKNLNRNETGLNSPDIVAMFSTPQTSVTVKIGREVPAQWANYAEIEGMAQAYFVPTHYKDTLSLKTDSSDQDIRRRRIFDLRPYQVGSLLLEGRSASVELRRSDNMSWRITQPLDDAADGKKIEDLLKTLEGVGVSAFDVAATNFGQPWLTLTVVEGTRSQRLQLGSEASGPGDYPNGAGVTPKTCWVARRLEYQQCFLVKKKDVEAFALNAATYRARSLFDTVGAGETTRFSQEVAGQRMEFEYVGRTWTMVGNQCPLLSSSSIDTYVQDWLDCDATNFADAAVAKAALAAPWVTMTAAFKTRPAPQTVVLSAPKDGLVYAERSPGVYVACDAHRVGTHLATNELGLLEDNVLDVPPDYVREIAMRAGQYDYKLMQTSNRWVCVTSNKVVDTTMNVYAVLKDGLPVKTCGYVARVTDKDLAAYGLAKPGRIISLVDPSGTARTLQVGSPLNGTNYYGMVAGQPYVFLLSREQMEKLCELDAATGQ